MDILLQKSAASQALVLKHVDEFVPQHRQIVSTAAAEENAVSRRQRHRIAQDRPTEPRDALPQPSGRQGYTVNHQYPDTGRIR